MPYDTAPNIFEGGDGTKNTKLEIMQGGEMEERMKKWNKRNGQQPDFLYTTYTSSWHKDELKDHKDVELPEHAVFNRVGITLWPSLEARGAYTGPEIRDMMSGDDTASKKKNKKADKKREREEKRKLDNMQNFLFAVIKGDAKEVEKNIKYGVDANGTIEQFIEAYFAAKGKSLGHDMWLDVAAAVEKSARAMMRYVEFPEAIHDALILNIKKMQGIAYWSPTPFIWSIILHHDDIFKIFLNHPDVDVNKVDPSMDATPLHEAIYVKNHRAVRRLLACKRFTNADVRSRGWNWDPINESGLTPLMSCITYSRTDYCQDYLKCLKYIVRSGRKINYRSEYVDLNTMSLTKACNTIHADKYLRLLDQGKYCWSCSDLDDSKETRLCRGCRAARYCGLQCQKDDWQRHRFYCSRKRRERRQEKPGQERRIFFNLPNFLRPESGERREETESPEKMVSESPHVDEGNQTEDKAACTGCECGHELQSRIIKFQVG